IVAYAEAREAYGDWAKIDVVMKRSVDGGEHWEPRTPLFVGEPGDTVNNPVMISERVTETLHLLYNLNYRRALFPPHQDGGKHWSSPVELPRVFEALRPSYNWRVIAFGPGHGIELANGRLLVPIWLSPGGGHDGHHPQHVATVYSDDGGTTWQAGELVMP